MSAYVGRLYWTRATLRNTGSAINGPLKALRSRGYGVQNDSEDPDAAVVGGFTSYQGPHYDFTVDHVTVAPWLQLSLRHCLRRSSRS